MTVSFSFTLDFLKTVFWYIRSYIFQYKTEKQLSLPETQPQSCSSLVRMHLQKKLARANPWPCLEATALSAPPALKDATKGVPLGSSCRVPFVSLLPNTKPSRADPVPEWEKERKEKEMLWHVHTGPRTLDKVTRESFQLLREDTFVNCPFCVCAHETFRVTWCLWQWRVSHTGPLFVLASIHS